jgi:hypothetical protein
MPEWNENKDEKDIKVKQLNYCYFHDKDIA